MNRKETAPVNTLTSRDGNPEKIRVLFYHRIADTTAEGESTGVTISQRTFRAHLALLEKWGYAPITFHDYQLYLGGVLSLPKKPVILTFDDGYKDLHTYALPVMKEFGMRGVIFIVGDRRMRTNEWDEGISPSYQLLDEEQILEFHEAGFEIGAHSMHHIRLTSVSASDAWEELHQARISIEILLNSPVQTFSYPYGLLNDELKSMAQQAGYSVACAAFSGPPVFGSDLLEVRRIKMIDTANPLNFWFRLQFVYVHYRWLWWQLKKAAIFINRRVAGLFHYHPKFVHIPTAKPQRHPVRITESETQS
jgi:peptidoglycan/xylan/chitin deacetylase (PgdA/CDA1 family)